MGWTAQTASDGYTYNIYLQDKENSCACASIVMAARLAKNKILDESTVRGWVQQAEGSVNTNAQGVRSFDDTGTAGDLLSSVFQKIQITSFTVKGTSNVGKWIVNTRRSHPAVVGVIWKSFNAGTGMWDSVGGHMVLAVNVHNNNVIFLDPGIGVVEIPITNLPVYAVTYAGSASVSQGYMEQMTTA